MTNVYLHKILAAGLPGIDLSGIVKTLISLNDRPHVIRRVLVAEDDASVRLVVMAQFRRTAEVVFASVEDDPDAQKNGAIAKVASEGPFDLVIVDGLYGRGPALVEALRDAGYKGWIATETSEGDLATAMEKNGADWHYPKPFHTGDLVRVSIIIDAIMDVVERQESH